jgi:hypothetical protein
MNLSSICLTITPHLGIGDLILVKMIEISNNLHIQHININHNLIKTYSSNYDSKLKFIKNLIIFLFPDTTYEVNNNNIDFISFQQIYSVHRVYLYDKINTSMLKHIDGISEDSIVFHTKFRYDGLIDKVYQYILPELIAWLTLFKTRKKIIIVGERTIGVNIETIIHKTKTLYNELLLLRNNNIVIDLTKETLTEGCDFNEFLYDINIIYTCACNVIFGVGGPLSLTSAFSNNNIAFLPLINESPYCNTIKKIHKNIIESVKELDERLRNL